ncbi:MAG: hypothetical protein EPN93_13215 [Spirochaetes bacterium]|nr:MAG: hypothetical protein EPN93_13215 [Spirochaetota bacterium]
MNFSGIYGHDIQRGRLETLFRRGTVPQTMLFTGMTGTGKFRVAERFLMAFFCEGKPAPCLDCAPCRQVQKDIHPDFIAVRPNERGIIPVGSEEKKERGSVRWLIERLSMKPVSGATAVIVDGIDRVTEEGQNALLKTIEEPAHTTKMILIAEAKSRVLPTIVSRSIEIPFNPLPDGHVLKILEAANIDPDIRRLSAFFAGGSASRAFQLSDVAFREKLFALCADISGALNRRQAPLIPGDLPGKLVSPDVLLDLMLVIYSKLLQSGLRGEELPGELPRELLVEDIDLEARLIKILLALKRGQSHNLNFRIALKGLLYSLYFEGERAHQGPLVFDI